MIAAHVCGDSVDSCERFPTGLRNWVYDVTFESGRQVVVRMSHSENGAELDGGLFWTPMLVECGVPVASIIAHDTTCEQPYVVLERLPGTDLGNVFDTLSPDDLARIAGQVGAMQHAATSLPRGAGFGYALSYDTVLDETWPAVLEQQVDRAEQWIRTAGVVDPSHAESVRIQLGASTSLLNDVAPIAFLHDATTKNVIVDAGQVTGLVDVDTMAFGDPLWAVALTRMSLLSARREDTYIDLLVDAMGIRYQQARLDLYTRIFCLTFLGELGQAFNQPSTSPVDIAHQQHLESVFANLRSSDGA